MRSSFLLRKYKSHFNKLIGKKEALYLISNMKKNYVTVLTVFGVFLIGISLSFLASQRIEGHYKTQEKTRFIHDIELYSTTVAKRFQIVESFLGGLRQLFQINPHLTRQEFKGFNDIEHWREYGIQAVAWSPIITHEERQNFLNITRHSGLFDFAIRDPGQDYYPVASTRTAYFPVLFIEPIHHSGHLLGVDIAQIFDRNGALSNVIKSGEMHVSAPNPLTINDTGAIGMWVHLPVYKNLPEKPTDAERRENFIGFVSAAITVEAIFSPIFTVKNRERNNILIQVQDAESGEVFNNAFFETQPGEILQPEMRNILKLAERPFTLTYSYQTGGENNWEKYTGIFVFILGSLSSLLFSIYILSNFVGRYRVEQKIQQRTRDLVSANQRLNIEIKHRERARSDQYRAETRYQRIFENAVEGIFVINRDGALLNANLSFAKILGFQTISDLHKEFKGFQEFITLRGLRGFRVMIGRYNHVINLECHALKKDKNTACLSINAHFVKEAGEEVIEGTVIDITNRKITEQQLNDLAYKDALTGCLNRRAFHDLLTSRYDSALQNGDWRFSLLFIDLDHFKMINDTQGHDIGDMVIQEVAQRLQISIRENRSIARLGGDEFAILIDNIDYEEQAIDISNRLLDRLNSPIHVNELSFSISGSIGVCLAGMNATQPADLLRNADLAMYQAKSRGRNQCVIYDEAFHADADEQLKIQTALSQAISKEQLSLVYQPILDLKTDELIAVEALIRWYHPEYGQISPALFIPIAETSGLVAEIGDWVLKQILVDLSHLNSDSPLKRVRVNMNVSPMQLMLPDFTQKLIKLCQTYHIAHYQIALEITETAMIGEQFDFNAQLRELREAGFKLLVDDFGTGYASLNQLTLTQWNGIKIDREFINGIGQDMDKVAIVKAVLEMAKMIGYDVTAEGIETAEQQKFLSELGCQFGQGYHLSRPITWEALQNIT